VCVCTHGLDCCHSSCRKHYFHPFLRQSLGDAGSAGIDMYWGGREEGREGVMSMRNQTLSKGGREEGREGGKGCILLTFDYGKTVGGKIQQA